MSVLNYLVDKLKSGIITFINAVTLTNRDLPYHDYHAFTENSTDLHYVVGQNQIDAHGNQSKHFVSKSTLIYANEDQTIRFNDSKNVGIIILADTWYEFKSNIWQVFATMPSENMYIKFYFEGVLPEEARSPE